MSLRPLSKEWRVILDDKDAAKSLVESLNTATDTDARLKTPTHCGIIRQVPNEILPNGLCSMIRNCMKAKRIRQTRSYKLVFESKDEIQVAMNNPIILGYESFRIDIYEYLPMRYFQCKEYGHAAKGSKNVFAVPVAVAIMQTKKLYCCTEVCSL